MKGLKLNIKARRDAETDKTSEPESPKHQNREPQALTLRTLGPKRA